MPLNIKDIKRTDIIMRIDNWWVVKTNYEINNIRYIVVNANDCNNDGDLFNHGIFLFKQKAIDFARLRADLEMS